MWLMTVHGFYSAVAAINEDGSTDTDRIVVRARTQQHLTNLKKRFKTLLKNTKIIEKPGTDYACRIVIKRSVWTAIVYELAEAIDYTNFKTAVPMHNDNGEYAHELHNVWSVMRRIQHEGI